MFKQPESVSFQLPHWLVEYAATYRNTTQYPAQMAFVIGAAQQNVQRRTGGPFAAAIFEQQSGVLVSLGVNLVLAQSLSMLHAEIVAMALAQRKIGDYDLGGPGQPLHRLVSSTEPCAMCLGAITWSGVREVITGATDQDARAIGFDEGPKPAHWTQNLRQRGIQVAERVCQTEAKQVLQHYAESGGHRYNSRER